jgi:hypothetical protein
VKQLAIRIVTVIMIGSAQLACMGACDIFPPTKDLPGGYQLLETENANYYITRDRQGNGGVLSGTISQLGWTDTQIVALRNGPQWGARGIGWMIINVASGQIDGPLSSEQCEARVRGDGALRAVKIYSIEEAWRRL